MIPKRKEYAHFIALKWDVTSQAYKRWLICGDLIFRLSFLATSKILKNKTI